MYLLAWLIAGSACTVCACWLERDVFTTVPERSNAFRSPAGLSVELEGRSITFSLQTGICGRALTVSAKSRFPSRKSTRWLSVQAVVIFFEALVCRLVSDAAAVSPALHGQWAKLRVITVLPEELLDIVLCGKMMQSCKCEEHFIALVFLA